MKIQATIFPQERDYGTLTVQTVATFLGQKARVMLVIELDPEQEWDEHDPVVEEASTWLEEQKPIVQRALQGTAHD